MESKEGNASEQIRPKDNMRILRLIRALISVGFNRFFLLLMNFYTALSLAMPIRYAFFPLLSRLKLIKPEFAQQPVACDVRLDCSIDVIVSLYNFEEYEHVLRESVKSCFSNSKITFHFVLASGNKTETALIESLAGNSHHKIHTTIEKIGIYAAWNLAIRRGSGVFITNLNADDLRLPHSICRQGVFLQQTGAHGSFGDFIFSSQVPSIQQLDDAKQLASKLGPFDEETLVFGSQNFMHCAPIWKRDLHKRFGGFDEDLKSSGDTEFWLRTMSQGADFVYFPQVTSIYFHNPLGLSTSLASAGIGEWRRVRNTYLRKRFLSRDQGVTDKVRVGL
jgi:glycosyltransferase involved in cell wall biosynthesis